MQYINQLENSKQKKFISIAKSKEFYLGDFYLKIELTNNKELSLINYNTKKLTWPISLPVGYMLREHVNRVRFPDWPNYFSNIHFIFFLKTIL